MSEQQWSAKLAFNKALAKFQATVGRLVPTHDANIPTKRGGKIQYKYAENADVIDHVQQALADNGLSYMQWCDRVDGQLMVMMELFHEAGDSRVGRMPVSAEGDMRALGSAVTYGKRYLAVAMLRLSIGGEDDDGTGAAEAANARRKRQANQWAEDARKAGELMQSMKACKTSEALWTWGTDNQEAIAALSADKVVEIKQAFASYDAKLKTAQTSGAPAEQATPPTATATQKPEPKTKTKDEPKPEPKPPKPGRPNDDVPPPPDTDADLFRNAFG